MLPKKNRLTTKEWDVVFKSGRRIKSSSFTFIVLEQQNLIGNKVGVSVSKKVAKTAVGRNTIKRWYMDCLDDFGRRDGNKALGVMVHSVPVDYQATKQEILSCVKKL